MVGRPSLSRACDACLQPLERNLWLVMSLVLVAEFTMLSAGRHGTSWHFFADAAHGLLTPAGGGDEGLDLFTAHPEYQFGLVSVLAAAPFAFLPPALGIPAASAFTSLLGVLALFLVVDAAHRLAPGVEPRRACRAELISGLAFTLAWTEISIRCCTSTTPSRSRRPPPR